MNVSFAELRVLALKGLRPTPAEKHRAKTINVMHFKHGVGEGTCADCLHLYDMPVDGAIRHAFKCRLFKVSSSATSDWRRSWPACGAKEPVQ